MKTPALECCADAVTKPPLWARFRPHATKPEPNSNGERSFACVFCQIDVVYGHPLAHARTTDFVPITLANVIFPN
jgi:hypothetical protein